MIDLMRICGDVAVFMAAFILGVLIHSALGFGSWFVPASMMPCFLWAVYRGAVPGGYDHKILIAFVIASVYLAFSSAIRKIAPGWPNQIHYLAVPLIFKTLIFDKTISQQLKSDEVHTPPIPN